MKHLKPKALFIFFLALIAFSCKKEHHDNSPLAQLSKLVGETQTGANTFGCLNNLIDGQVFTSSNQFLKPQNIWAVYAPLNGYYSLSITALRETAPFVYASVTLQTDSLAVAAGQTYNLTTTSFGKASASYEVQNYGAYSPGNDDLYKTIASNPGKLTITHYDEIKYILSGTFSFDAVNAQGNAVHISDGRFDVIYRPY